MTKEPPTYLGCIIHDPEILAGKAVVKETRIPVELVLAKLAHNPDLEEVLADYPRLTIDDVEGLSCERASAGAERREDSGRSAQAPRHGMKFLLDERAAACLTS